MIKAWVLLRDDGAVINLVYKDPRVIPRDALGADKKHYKPMFLVPCGPLQELLEKFRYYAEVIKGEWSDGAEEEAKRLIAKLEDYCG